MHMVQDLITENPFVFRFGADSEFSSHKIFCMLCFYYSKVSSAVVSDMILPVPFHVEINSELILSEISKKIDNQISR